MSLRDFIDKQNLTASYMLETVMSYENSIEKLTYLEFAEYFYKAGLNGTFEDKNTKIPKEFIQGHRKKMFNDEDIAQMVIMREKGLSYQKIATKFRCSKTTIIKYLKNHRRG